MNKTLKKALKILGPIVWMLIAEHGVPAATRLAEKKLKKLGYL